jgi:hypothetical protein
LERITLPENKGMLRLHLYAGTGDVSVQTVNDVSGGSVYELAVPAWNEWFRLEVRDAASGSLLQTMWLGHLRTH